MAMTTVRTIGQDGGNTPSEETQAITEAQAETGTIVPTLENPIEGGDIIEADDGVKFVDSKHRAETTKLLTLHLIYILAGSWLINFLVITYFHYVGKSEAAESISKAFSNWLPVMSGFVGSAVTYYLTERKKDG